MVSRFASPRILSLALSFLATACTTVQAVATTLPFSSNGSLGAFAPEADVVFNTDTGQYTIGSSTFIGGRVLEMGANLPAGVIETMAFDFTSFNVPNGVVITGTGSRVLTLLATQNIAVNGVINVSGTPGSSSGAGGGGGGGGGGVGIGAGQSTVTNLGLISVLGPGGVSEQGGLGGVGGIYILADAFQTDLGVMEGPYLVDSIGFSDAASFVVTGGNGGGGGAGPGQIVPEPRTFAFVGLSLFLLWIARYTRDRRKQF